MDSACQSELTSLQRKNWVMENDALRQRIDEIRREVELCRRQVGEASETAASDYECTRRMGLLSSQNEEEIGILNRELRGFEDRLRLLKTEFEDYELAAGRKISERERELLQELDQRIGAK